MNAILTIHENGNVTTLYTEQIPLEEIGPLEIARASTVEFNETTQLWDVKLSNASGKVGFSHKSRAQCIAWEIETLNGRV